MLLTGTPRDNGVAWDSCNRRTRSFFITLLTIRRDLLAPSVQLFLLRDNCTLYTHVEIVVPRSAFPALQYWVFCPRLGLIEMQEVLCVSVLPTSHDRLVKKTRRLTLCVGSKNSVSTPHYDANTPSAVVGPVGVRYFNYVLSTSP